MSAAEAEERRREASRWADIAAEDSRVAQACLRLEQPALGMAAYHCQQAAEKLLKGLLIIAGVDFAPTHDLNRLTSAAEAHFPDALALFEAIRPLTPWGVAYRYPGPDPVPEPLPSVAEVERVLSVIAGLAARLRTILAGDSAPR
jgi:HEPN domain-containing protein